MNNNPCESEINGEIVKIKGDRAFVKFERSAACNGCKACMLANAKKEIVLPAKNPIGARMGDRVRLAMSEQKPVHTWMVLFVLPLFLMISGVLIGYLTSLNEILIAVCALLGLAVGLAAIFVLDRVHFSNKYLARVLEIIDDNQGEKRDD